MIYLNRFFIHQQNLTWIRGELIHDQNQISAQFLPRASTIVFKDRSSTYAQVGGIISKYKEHSTNGGTGNKSYECMIVYFLLNSFDNSYLPIPCGLVFRHLDVVCLQNSSDIIQQDEIINQQTIKVHACQK